MTSAEFSIRHLVSFDETNLVGNVYFAHYARWQGHCRESFLLQESPGVLRTLQDRELALVTLNLGITYIDECFAGDTVEIAMRSTNETRANRIGMSFSYRRDGVTVATGTQTVACMRRTPDGLLPVAVPDELGRALDRYRA